VLLDRSRPGDRSKAATLLRTSLATASALEMAPLAAEATALLARM
jgi:hypothetical protein